MKVPKQYILIRSQLFLAGPSYFSSCPKAVAHGIAEIIRCSMHTVALSMDQHTTNERVVTVKQRGSSGVPIEAEQKPCNALRYWLPHLQLLSFHNFHHASTHGSLRTALTLPLACRCRGRFAVRLQDYSLHQRDAAACTGKRVLIQQAMLAHLRTKKTEELLRRNNVVEQWLRRLLATISFLPLSLLLQLACAVHHG